MQHFRAIILLALATFSFASQAQEAADSTSQWTKTTSLGLSFSNVGLENWAGGGVSSVALGFVGQFKAVRETGASVWTNQFDLAYGLQKQQGNATFRKTDDQLILVSQYGRKLSEQWLLSAGLNFRTQMDLGYTYGTDANGEETRAVISKLLAPGYLTANLGLTYKKGQALLATISPITNKNTIVADDSLAALGAFGVEPGKKLRAEFGAGLTGTFAKKVMENVNFSTSLALFTNYETFGKFDVNWETLISMKINKYMNASFGTQLIYDEDVDVLRNDGTTGPAVQFKHVLNIGLGVTF
jgi:hypothetical protein